MSMLRPHNLVVYPPLCSFHVRSLLPFLPLIRGAICAITYALRILRCEPHSSRLMPRGHPSDREGNGLIFLRLGLDKPGRVTTEPRI